MDAGTNEEDSGDRWLSSGDLAKAVRFYQRAYVYYNRAIELGDGSGPVIKDAKYNILRMKYVIYVQVIKPGKFERISNNLENEGLQVIEKDIGRIARAHFDECEAVGGMEICDIDLLFNYAQTMSEFAEAQSEAESRDGEGPDYMSIFKTAIMVFRKVATRQEDQLDGLNDHHISAQDLDGDENMIDADKIKQIKEEQQQEQGEEEEEGSTNFGPTALIETYISLIQCLMTFMECVADDERHHEVGEGNAFSASEVTDALLSALAKYYYDLDPQLIEEAQIINYKAMSAAINFNSPSFTPQLRFERLQMIWADTPLPEIPQQYLVKADAFLDLASHDADNLSNDQDFLWSIYSVAVKSLNTALALAKQQKNYNLAQKIYVSLAEAELLRSDLPNSANSQKNRPTLLKNVRTYYSNVIKLPVFGSTDESEELVKQSNEYLDSLPSI